MNTSRSMRQTRFFAIKEVTMLRILRLGFLLSFIASTHVSGAEYWVNNITGSDSNAGTENEPWKTLSLSLKSLEPGDELIIQSAGIDKPFAEVIDIQVSGTSDNPIVVRGASLINKPRIVGDGAKALISILSREYIIIQDLIIENTSDQGIVIGKGSRYIDISGVEIRNIEKNGILVVGGEHIKVRNCKIDNVGNSGIAFIGHPTDKLSDTLIENCRISNVQSNDGITLHQDSELNDIGENHVIRGNYLEKCAEEGLDITSGSNIAAEKNMTTENYGGINIDHGARKVRVIDHVSVDDYKFGIVISSPSEDVRVESSYFIGNNTSARLVIDGLRNSKIFSSSFITQSTAGSIVDFVGDNDGVEFVGNLIASTVPRDGATMFRRFASSTAGVIFQENTWSDPSDNSRVFYDDTNGKYAIGMHQILNNSNDVFLAKTTIPKPWSETTIPAPKLR